MWVYFLETLYFIKYKFTKLIPQRYFVVPLDGWFLVLFRNAHALQSFTVLMAMGGILAELSQRLATPLKYFVRYCLQLGRNCLLICFRSRFCIYLRCKQLPKVSLPLTRTLVPSSWGRISALSIIAAFVFWAVSSVSREGRPSLAISQKPFHSTPTL